MRTALKLERNLIAEESLIRPLNASNYNGDRYTFIPANENGEMDVKTEIRLCQPVKLKNHRGKSIRRKTDRVSIETFDY